MRSRPVLAASVAVLLVGGACGGSDDSSSAGDGSTSDATTTPVAEDLPSTEPGGGLPADPAAGPDAGFDPVVAAEGDVAATLALASFGDLQNAVVAILSAYDAGFSYDQIIEAIENATLAADGTIAGGEPEESLGAGQPVGLRRPVPRDLDIDALREELAKVQGVGTASIEDAEHLFLELILQAARDGYPVDVIVEAIVFGAFTEETSAAMEARSRVLRREELRDELDYCRMRASMAAVTGFTLTYEQCVLDQTGETVDELYGPRDDDVDETLADIAEDDDDTPPAPVGSGGLGPNPVIPGPDGSMTRESITLTVDGTTATLIFDLAFTTAVDYVDEAPVCFDDFTFTSRSSNLTVDGAQISGTTELILNFDGGTQCPQSEQDDIGVPQLVDISGHIDGDTLIGELSIAGLDIPFTAIAGEVPS
jgi:hypothetical protein